jgi:hypothetical protein
MFHVCLPPQKVGGNVSVWVQRASSNDIGAEIRFYSQRSALTTVSNVSRVSEAGVAQKNACWGARWCYMLFLDEFFWEMRTSQIRKCSMLWFCAAIFK